MAIDLTKISSMDTKIASEVVTKTALFVVSADKTPLPTPVAVASKEELREGEVDEKEDQELDRQIGAMVSRWLRTSKNELLKEDQDQLKELAKKMYYERLKTGESRVVWRVLKEYITGVKLEMF